jgi:DNA-binding CsgD family transcriptional regulator
MSRGSLLERERELAGLEHLAADVGDGAGGTIVIEGQPGLGKSTLLSEAARRTRRRGGVTTLEFCCGELEQELAWAGIRGLLGEWLASLASATRAELFAGQASPAAALFDDADGIDDGRQEDGFGTVHALFALLSRLARRQPLMLLLDDVHWCDGQSLQLLAYLQRRVHALPIGLVISMRPPTCSPQPALIERLRSGPDTEVHRLGSLGVRSVSSLVHEHGFPHADPNFCEACWQVTAGNPFYLRELLIELRHRHADVDIDGSPEELAQVTPPSVLSSLVLRLDRLEATGASALARASAILGDGATLRHAAALAELDDRQAVEALDALSTAQLLAPEEPLRFLHPLVRTAIYSDIPAARRAHQHARAAQLLAGDEVSAEKVALHLLHAPRIAAPSTVAVLREAAARARAHGAPQSAVRYLRRALQEPPATVDRADLLIELAQVETAIGDTEAVGRLREALALIGDERRRAGILLELGWAEHHAGRFEPAADAFERGLAIATDLRDPDLEAQLEAGYLVSATLDSRRVTDAARRIRIIEQRPAEVQNPGHRMLLAQVLFTRTMSGAPHREIIDLAQRIWADGQLLRDEGADSQTLWHVVGALSWSDAYAPSLAVIELALQAADEQGLALAHARARYARAWPHLWMGRIPEAVADAWAAIEIWNGGLETYLPAAIYWFGLASLELDNATAAERALALAGPEQRWESTGMMGFIHGLKGHLAFRAGRVQEALAAFEACGQVMRTLLIMSPSVMPWRSEAAQALTVLGEGRQARKLALQELELARASGAPRAIGVALRTSGLCAAHAHARVRLLDEAVQVLAPTGAVLEHARALVELGAAMRRGGKLRDSRPHLQAGLELAQSGGATVLARRAETELRASGGRARRATDTGPGLLTASERRVAELAASGHSNRTIAGLLQISIKAVEWHLHQSYRKLDIQGRRQLPTALAS